MPLEGGKCCLTLGDLAGEASEGHSNGAIVVYWRIVTCHILIAEQNMKARAQRELNIYSINVHTWPLPCVHTMSDFVDQLLEVH